MERILALVLLSGCIVGCRTTDHDRLPATAVDNPDPIMGGNAKLRPPPGQDNTPAVAAATPTGQQKPTSQDRIGPLTFQPKSTPAPEPVNTPGLAPSTASLTRQVKEVPPEPTRDPQVQPVQNAVPASSPEVVQNYRQRLAPYGVVGLRTKAIANGTWEAVAHFPLPSRPNDLRRIEAHGATESDALLAIVEQVEKPQ